jgi:hypothetical protein
MVTGKADHDDDDLHGHIVALPCAHVYHAKCLCPWFSCNTICPTCRFDVDPESLTWTPRPPANEPPPPHIPPGVPAKVHPEVQDPINPQAEHQQRASPMNAARFTAFVNSIFQGGTSVHPQLPQPAPLLEPVLGLNTDLPDTEYPEQNTWNFPLATCTKFIVQRFSGTYFGPCGK